MPHQNRVTPFGDLIATPARGLVYGNRGCLHDEQGRIRRTFNGKRWIACRLEFRGWRRTPLLQPGRFTELFFLDEATAFAAGHRPCALCRREDYNRLGAIWSELHPGQAGADAVDAQLHTERLGTGNSRRLHERPLREAPDGAIVVHLNQPHLVLGNRLLRWNAGGYEEGVSRPNRVMGAVLTPPSLLAVLEAGWEPVVPLVHPSAFSGRWRKPIQHQDT